MKSEQREMFTILIADRNPHVREFLRREMMAEGYRVRLAKNGQEVLRWIYHYEPLDLVILDLDLPDANDAPLLDKLNDRIPTLPVVVHTLSTHDVTANGDSLPVVFVEKEGNSIENLKKVVADMLLKTHPYRTQDRAMDEARPAPP